MSRSVPAKAATAAALSPVLLGTNSTPREADDAVSVRVPVYLMPSITRRPCGDVISTFCAPTCTEGAKPSKSVNASGIALTNVKLPAVTAWSVETWLVALVNAMLPPPLLTTSSRPAWMTGFVLAVMPSVPVIETSPVASGPAT